MKKLALAALLITLVSVLYVRGYVTPGATFILDVIILATVAWRPLLALFLFVLAFLFG